MSSEHLSHYAHSLKDRPIDDWETMAEHEDLVAKHCSQFLSRISPELKPWGNLLGRWHDLGKYSVAFQNYLRTENDLSPIDTASKGRVDHATAGAQHAYERLQQIGRLIAYVIAGHHSGLADADSASGASGLNQRLKKVIEPFDDAPAKLLNLPEPLLPKLNLCSTSSDQCAFQISLIGRMMFSALCDADFLATETFMSPKRKIDRNSRQTLPLVDLKNCLKIHLDHLAATANPSAVNEQRAAILEQCRSAANKNSGLFSLTVPTGGGKTLSSLAFALDHALNNGLDRVIYAIPFTSIVEQTTSVFQKALSDLGADVVLEHHSSIDPEKESRAARLATENWDAPLIVTTNVQLFDSLFASKTSRCRKLHRIANSVIILDEAQTIPVELLAPTLAVIRELVELFGCTVVICSATPPAISQRKNFPIGLNGITEIVSDPMTLHHHMKRVEHRSLGQLNDTDLIENLHQHESFLCIVNTRNHASCLYELTKSDSEPSEPTDDLFHLSTFMCGAHRKQKLDEIRERLRQRLPCRVFSTQLIEAGVDVDFPVVFRAMTGLDSISQAAGRCNREGLLDRGTLYSFEPTDVRLFGYLKNTAETGSEVCGLFDDPLSLDAVEKYFQLHFFNQKSRWDEREVLPCFRDPGALVFQYRTAADRYQMIRDNGRPVFVAWGPEGSELEELLRGKTFAENPGFRRKVLRRCQRFMVSVYENVYHQLLGSDIELLHDTVPVLLNPDMYDAEDLGLRLDKAGHHEPESLIW